MSLFSLWSSLSFAPQCFLSLPVFPAVQFFRHELILGAILWPTQAFFILLDIDCFAPRSILLWRDTTAGFALVR